MIKRSTLEYWEPVFVDYITAHNEGQSDASHDLGHFSRVYRVAKSIASSESASVDLFVILAAAYFHDIVSLPKNHPDNKMSSHYAATKAKQILKELSFPNEKIDLVCHAIQTHSFSAGLQPETIEAKIIQDADRMESLGALGAMRTFYVSGRIGRFPFDSNDLYAKQRPLDDKIFGLDHFYVKLFKLPDLLQTSMGRCLANKRVEFLKHFVEELDANVKNRNGGALFIVEACYQAGHHHFQLFDLLNPLAYNRPLNPKLFVIDHVISAQEQFPIFINKFLTQFQEEVGTVNSSTDALVAS